MKLLEEENLALRRRASVLEGLLGDMDKQLQVRARGGGGGGSWVGDEQLLAEPRAALPGQLHGPLPSAQPCLPAPRPPPAGDGGHPAERFAMDAAGGNWQRARGSPQRQA